MVIHPTVCYPVLPEQSSLRTSSGWFKHSEPHRTYTNHFITELARCVEVYHRSSGWFDCTEPSLCTAQRGLRNCFEPQVGCFYFQVDCFEPQVGCFEPQVEPGVLQTCCPIDCLNNIRTSKTISVCTCVKANITNTLEVMIGQQLDSTSSS